MHEATDPFLLDLRLRRDLLAEGWHDRAIAAEVRAGRWVRPRHGAYVSKAGWDHLDDVRRHVVRTRAVVRQAKTDVVVSHQSAVPWWAGPTWGLDLTDVHTTRRDGKTGRHEAGVVQHCGVLLDQDVVLKDRVAVMSPTRTALEVSTVATTEAALVVMTDFLHRGLMSPEQVRERYAATMAQWPASRATDVVIRLADPRLESVLETRFYYFCFISGLPRPIPQYEVRTPDGHVVAKLDFAWPELRAYVETDGKGKYLRLLGPGQEPGDVVARERRREELVGTLTDLRPMHVGWEDLEQPRLTLQRLDRHLWPARSRVG